MGIPSHQIAVELKMLLDDAQYWYNHEVYPAIELAMRFKHRLVSIHCFPNGNGRHSRLVADLIMEKLFDDLYFSWGGSLLTADDKRHNYIKVLQLADKGLYDDLIAFAQS